MNKIRIAIAGYGNLGKSVETLLQSSLDMELVCIFTRRNEKELKVKSNVSIVNEKDIIKWKDKIDVVILCGGSANDLPVQGPKYAEIFNTVDAYDNHKNALKYVKSMDNITKYSDKISISCVGWDPGLFSLFRLLIKSIIPNAHMYTFWGPRSKPRTLGCYTKD